VSARVEIHGLEFRGRHGVNEDERTTEQAFLYDVVIDVAEPPTDDVDATVDYRGLRDVVRAVSDERSYQLLESLAAAAADAIVHAFPVERVSVRVRKPGVAWAEWTAATVERVSTSRP
jgi:dihydroneopterin aldolase